MYHKQRFLRGTFWDQNKFICIHRLEYKAYLIGISCLKLYYMTVLFRKFSNIIIINLIFAIKIAFAADMVLNNKYIKYLQNV